MPSPNNPTRVTAGFVDATQDGAFGNFRQLRPDAYIEDYDEFLSYLAGNWILTETAAGSTETISATGNGGWFLITNVSAGATDEASIQWSGGNAAVITPWTFDGTKDFYLAAKLKVDAVATTALLVGLASADTTPVASLPANGIFFSKTAAGDLNLIVAKATVNTTVQLVPAASLVDDTFYSVVLAYTAADQTWRTYVNDVATPPAAGFPVGTAIAPVLPITKTIGLLNASAAAHILSVDYLFVAQRRSA